VYPRETQAAALELRAVGMSVTWIARELRVAPRTVRRWLSGETHRVESPWPLCPASYSYLLGLYLGDGHISVGARRQPYLTVSCDAAYPEIVDSVRRAIESVMPGRRVWLSRHPTDRCVRVIACSRWWPVLFPQHGAGRKHARRIALAAWQRSITAAHPRELVRGLMLSDGSRFVANQRASGKQYSYPRYAFTNRSHDIVAILCAHLDLLGIGWTAPRRGYVAIDRRAEVAKLDEFIGPKR
jgi:hypothetical protein